MYINFNKSLKKLIKKTSKKVAKILHVDDVSLVIITENGSIELCFGSSIDDTYADLKVSDTDNPRLEDIIENFIDNKSVEWMDRRVIITPKRKDKNAKL